MASRSPKNDAPSPWTFTNSYMKWYPGSTYTSLTKSLSPHSLSPNTSRVLLEPARHVPASGMSHIQFSMPGVHFSHTAALLLSNVTFSVRPSQRPTVTPFNAHAQHFLSPFLNLYLWYIYILYLWYIYLFIVNVPPLHDISSIFMSLFTALFLMSTHS